MRDQVGENGEGQRSESRKGSTEEDPLGGGNGKREERKKQKAE